MDLDFFLPKKETKKGGRGSGNWGHGGLAGVHGGSSSGSGGDSVLKGSAMGVAEDVLGALRRHPMSKQADFESDHDRPDISDTRWSANKSLTIDIRYFGDWTRSGQDYDYEKPEKNTQAEIDRMVSEFSDKYPDWKITCNSGEKYWLSFVIKPQK